MISILQVKSRSSSSVGTYLNDASQVMKKASYFFPFLFGPDQQAKEWSIGAADATAG
jgi:hypothetical protein